MEISPSTVSASDVCIAEDVFQWPHSPAWMEFENERVQARKLSLNTDEGQSLENAETLRLLAENAVRCGQLTTALQTYTKLEEKDDLTSLEQLAATSPRPSLWHLTNWHTTYLMRGGINIGAKILEIISVPLKCWGENSLTELTELEHIQSQLNHYETELKKYNVNQTRRALRLLCCYDIVDKVHNKPPLSARLDEVIKLLTVSEPNPEAIINSLSSLRADAQGVNGNLKFHTFDRAMQHLELCQIYDVGGEVGRSLRIPNLRVFARALCCEAEGVAEDNLSQTMTVRLSTRNVPEKWMFIALHLPTLPKIAPERWEQLTSTQTTNLEGWGWCIRLVMELGGQAHLRWQNDSVGYKKATGVGAEPDSIDWPGNIETGHCLMLCIPEERL